MHLPHARAHCASNPITALPHVLGGMRVTRSKKRLTHASKSIIGLDFGIHPMSRHTARIRWRLPNYSSRQHLSARQHHRTEVTQYAAVTLTPEKPSVAFKRT